MIKRTALSLAIGFVGVFPNISSALGLGELQSNSQLNQPLRASIKLLSTSLSEAGKLKIGLASASVFSRVGISRPDYLNSLQFRSTTVNGQPIIQITSSKPINEPFLNFLLEVSWPQGQLLKEYTILLDPPVLMQSEGGASDAAAVRAEPRNTGVIRREQTYQRQMRQQQEQQRQAQQRQAQQRQEQQRQAQLQRQRQVQLQRQAANTRQYDEREQKRLARLRAQRHYEWQQKQRKQSKRPTINHSQRNTLRRMKPTRTTRYRVKRGDNLSRIAKKLKYNNVTSSQMMLALFRANPKAFRKNNINNLKSGVILKVPSRRALRRSSSKSARKMVKQHHLDWRNYRKGVSKKTVAQKTIPKQRSHVAKTPSLATTLSEAKLKVVGSEKKSVKASNAGTVDESLSILALKKELLVAREQLATSKEENSDLRNRVVKLEAMLRKKDRLINLKNEHLAQLEASLKNANTEPSSLVNSGLVTPEPVSNNRENNTQTADIANDIANKMENEVGNIIRNEDSERRQPEVIEKEEEADTSPFIGKDTQEKSGLLSFLTSPLVTAIGGGSFLLLSGLWFALRRRKATADMTDFDEDFMSSEFADKNDDITFDQQIIQAEKNDLDFDDFDNFDKPIKSAEKNDIDDFSKTMEETAPKSKSESNPINTNALKETKNKEDDLYEDELLQEAGVYIVYGLHDQAEEELTKAIEQHPTRLEYRHKLLENYQVENNQDAFKKGVNEFLQANGDNKQKLWDKIRNLGKSLGLDNDILAESSVEKAASKLKGSASKPVSKGILAGAAGVAAGAASMLGSKASEAGDKLDAMKDLAGDKLDSMKDSAGDALGDLSNDLSDKASNFKDNASDKLDDMLDIDMLNDLDGLADQEKNKINKATDLDGLASQAKNKIDETTDLDDAFDLEGDLDLDDLDLDFGDDLDLGALDDDLKSLTKDLDEKANSVAKNSTDKIEGVSLSIDQDTGLDQILSTGNTYSTKGQPEKELSADLNNANAPSNNSLANDALSFLDLPDDDAGMQDAHISTKIDLARAYLDMGDVDGARSTLEEVIKEGNAAQRQEAQEILHQTG